MSKKCMTCLEKNHLTFVYILVTRNFRGGWCGAVIIKYSHSWVRTPNFEQIEYHIM